MRFDHLSERLHNLRTRYEADVTKLLEATLQEDRKIQAAILGDSPARHTTKKVKTTTRKSPKFKMTLKERRAIGRRMKAYWAARRKAAK